MRVLVTGDRHWKDKGLVHQVLKDLLREYRITTLIEGEAPGADLISRKMALSLGVDVAAFPANWTKYGKAAGPVRNQRMLDEGKPDFVVAFHDNLAMSRGTKNMVERAERAGLPVIRITH